MNRGQVSEANGHTGESSGGQGVGGPGRGAPACKPLCCRLSPLHLQTPSPKPSPHPGPPACKGVMSMPSYSEQHSPRTPMARLSQAPPVSRETRLPATARPPLASLTAPRCVFSTAHPAGSAPAQTAPAQRPHGVQAEWANSQQQKHNTLRQRPMPLRELQKGGVCRLGSPFHQGPCQRPDTTAPFKA